MPNNPTPSVVRTQSGITMRISRWNWVSIERGEEKLGWFHKDTLKGKSVREITQFCADVAAASTAVRAKFDAFKASLPESVRDKVSYGYIGNYEMWGDETSWRIFYNVPQERFCQSVGSYSQARMPEFLANWDKHEARVRAALTKGYGVDVTIPTAAQIAEISRGW